jgi:hypothetical protein
MNWEPESAPSLRQADQRRGRLTESRYRLNLVDSHVADC